LFDISEGLYLMQSIDLAHSYP